MNHYRHHIGDYRKDTSHLSLLEHGIYRQALDLYYLEEAPLPADMKRLMRLLCVRNADEERSLCAVLDDFFALTDEGYVHARCERELEAIYAKSEKARESASKRWDQEKQTVSSKKKASDANAMRTHSEGNAKAMLPSNPVPSNPVPNKNPLVDSDEPTGKQPKAKSSKNDTPPEFETLWAEYPQREGPNPKRDALKAYRARMREGVSPDDLLAGVRRYREWLMRKGKVGTEFVQRASTFLGPGENWKQSFEAGVGGLSRPPATDRDAWLRLAKQAGVENRIAGKTHDQVWDMICESLAQQEVA